MAQAMGQQGSLVLAPGTFGSPPVATWLLQFRDANDVHWKAVSLLFIIIYFINFLKEVILSHLMLPVRYFLRVRQREARMVVCTKCLSPAQMFIDLYSFLY